MSLESKEELLHGQMQKGLLLKLMENPAVSAALDIYIITNRLSNWSSKLFQMKLNCSS